MNNERLTSAFKRLIRETFPRLNYFGMYEYRIAGQSGTRFDCRPATTDLGMPDIVNVDVRPSLAGSASDLADGTLVLIAFANGDPSKPFIAWAEPDGSSGFEPTETRIDASGSVVLQGGTLGAARFGDTVQAGPFAGTITTASTKVKVG